MKNRMHDSTKLMYHRDTVERHFLKGEHTPPIHLDVGIAKFCNVKCVFCVAGTTKILMSDFTLKEIRDVRVGDSVIGFNEDRKGRMALLKHSLYFPTIVTQVFKRRARTHKIQWGQTWLRITNEHKILCAGHRWRPIKRIKTGDLVRYFSEPYETNQKENYLYKLGYLKGVCEGDGTICTIPGYGNGKNKYGQRKFKVQMNDVDAIDRIEKYFLDLFCIKLKRPKPILVRTDSWEEVDIIDQALIFRKKTNFSEYPLDFSRGYLAGIFDAEGSISVVIRIAQKKNLTVIDNIEQCLKLHGFEYAKEPNHGFRVKGGFKEQARFFGQCRPAIQRKLHKLYNHAIPKTVPIEKYIYGAGGITEDVYNIETEARTYVASGFCVHNCYGKYQNVKQESIKRDALLSLIRDAGEIGVKSMALIGDGEPTVNKHLYEALALARDLGKLDMALSTNGELITQEVQCQTILSACKWMRFCISAGTREGYKLIHQKDCFEKVVENIRRMVEVKKRDGYTCEIGMQSVFIPGLMNQEMIAEARLAVDLGVDFFLIKQCSLPDEGETGILNFDLAEYDKPETIAALKECEALATDKTDIIVKWNIMKLKGTRNYKNCPSVPFISEISGNGNFYPCGHFFNEAERFEQFKFGNIHDKSLKEIIASDHYWEVIRKMREEFNVQTQCRGACRLDATNSFCASYLEDPVNFKWPESVPDNLYGINFI